MEKISDNILMVWMSGSDLPSSHILTVLSLLFIRSESSFCVSPCSNLNSLIRLLIKPDLFLVLSAILVSSPLQLAHIADGFAEAGDLVELGADVDEGLVALVGGVENQLFLLWVVEPIF